MRTNLSEILEFYHTAATEELLSKADRSCRDVYGRMIFIRGLIEFSNICSCDCLYCGIRNSNSGVNRYRMSVEDIVDCTKAGYEFGFRTFVLQGGEDMFFDTGRICSIIERIKNTAPDAAVTLSAGIRSRKSYMEIRNAGCDRYLLRFETSDEKLHSYLRNGISLKTRLNALDNLKDLGYEVGSGFMTGLPGETEDIRIGNAVLCHQYEFDMVGIGPFIPHSETPLSGSPQESIELTLRSAALIRLLLPHANIPATTAAGSLDIRGREKMLSAGANVLMPNITPVALKKDYQLYPGKICLDESGFECIGCLSARAESIGKEISFERGDSFSYLGRGI